jgi:plastocyanin domain-containing protein
MIRKLALVSVALFAFAACDKSDKSKAADQTGGTTAGTVAADGTRSVAIAVKKDGYHPEKIQAKAGEKLKLVFTRVEDTECGAQVKVADGSLVDLPLGQAVEIPLTAPATGEVKFVCGMEMMTGAIVVDAKS